MPEQILSVDDEDALPPGTLVGDYVLDVVVGRGGFAIGYRGHHVRLTEWAL